MSLLWNQLSKLASTNPLSGGLAEEEDVESADVSLDELLRGIKVEMEHTEDPEAAKEIALDHLTEIPDYYTRLDEMEEEAEQGKKTGD
jgi:hypothetical protein